MEIRLRGCPSKPLGLSGCARLEACSPPGLGSAARRLDFPDDVGLSPTIHHQNQHKGQQSTWLKVGVGVSPKTQSGRAEIGPKQQVSDSSLENASQSTLLT